MRGGKLGKNPPVSWERFDGCLQAVGNQPKVTEHQVPDNRYGQMDLAGDRLSDCLLASRFSVLPKKKKKKLPCLARQAQAFFQTAVAPTRQAMRRHPVRPMMMLSRANTNKSPAMTYSTRYRSSPAAPGGQLAAGTVHLQCAVTLTVCLGCTPSCLGGLPVQPAYVGAHVLPRKHGSPVESCDMPSHSGSGPGKESRAGGKSIFRLRVLAQVCEELASHGTVPI